MSINATDNGQLTTDQLKDYVRYETRRQFLSRGSNAVSWAALAALLGATVWPLRLLPVAQDHPARKIPRQGAGAHSPVACHLRPRPSR